MHEEQWGGAIRIGSFHWFDIARTMSCKIVPLASSRSAAERPEAATMIQPLITAEQRAQLLAAKRTLPATLATRCLWCGCSPRTPMRPGC